MQMTPEMQEQFGKAWAAMAAAEGHVRAFPKPLVAETRGRPRCERMEDFRARTTAYLEAHGSATASELRLTLRCERNDVRKTLDSLIRLGRVEIDTSGAVYRYSVIADA